MANSILHDIHGPDWPLGFIAVATPGTPVRITDLIDPPVAKNAPESPTIVGGSAEYTPRVNKLVFYGQKPNTDGMHNNTGNVYILRYNTANNGGSGNRDDYGVIVGIVIPGGVVAFDSPFQRVDALSPYRYALDADNAGDGALVIAWV